MEDFVCGQAVTARLPSFQFAQEVEKHRSLYTDAGKLRQCIRHMTHLINAPGQHLATMTDAHVRAWMTVMIAQHVLGLKELLLYETRPNPDRPGKMFVLPKMSSP